MTRQQILYTLFSIHHLLPLQLFLGDFLLSLLLIWFSDGLLPLSEDHFYVAWTTHVRWNTVNVLSMIGIDKNAH